MRGGLHEPGGGGMTNETLKDIEKLESDLWEAADIKLR